LHSALAIEAQQGQTLGLLWQNFGIGNTSLSPKDETPEQKNNGTKVLEKLPVKDHLPRRNLTSG
jgi:hypothetical protein